MRIALATIHLLALGIGLGAIFARARAANRLQRGIDALPSVLAADSWWGLAAFLWISTGLWRWLGSVEKSASYYVDNHIFLGKMTLLAIVLALELWPMITMIRWRIAQGRGTIDPVQLANKGRIVARISDVQLLLVIGMVVAATMMARGYGAR